MIDKNVKMENPIIFRPIQFNLSDFNGNSRKTVRKKQKSLFRCQVVFSDTGCWVHDIIKRRDMFELTTAGASAFNNTVWYVRESGVFIQASIVCVLCGIEVNGSITRTSTVKV